MDFAVTVVGLRETTLEAIQKLVKTNDQKFVRVDDTDWPTSERLTLNWNVQNRGRLVTVASARDDRYAVLSTQPLIHRTKRKYQWFDSEGELREYRDRINEFGKDTFFFADDEEVWCAIFASSKSDDTKRITRDLLMPQVAVDTEPDSFTVPDDMIYWLLYRFLSNQKQIDGVLLADVRGYFGESSNGHKIRGQGSRITTHLSTLGLVVENEPLKAIEIEAVVGSDRVVFAMMEDGSCIIDDNSRCPFAKVPNTFDQQILLTIFVYTRVLPVLKSAFQATVKRKAWDKSKRLAFTQSVAKTLTATLQTKFINV